MALAYETLNPGVYSFFDQRISMNERRLASFIRVVDFTVVLPLAQEQNLTSGLRSDPQHTINMALFHDKNEIGFADQCRSQLASLVVHRRVAAFLEDFLGGRFKGVVDEGSQASRADLNVRIRLGF